MLNSKRTKQRAFAILIALLMMFSFVANVGAKVDDLTPEYAKPGDTIDILSWNIVGPAGGTNIVNVDWRYDGTEIDDVFCAQILLNDVVYRTIYLLAPIDMGYYPIAAGEDVKVTLRFKIADGAEHGHLVDGYIQAYTLTVEGALGTDGQPIDPSGHTIIDALKPEVDDAYAIPDPAKAGSVAVTVEFSEAMDMGVGPNVMVTGLDGSYTVVGGFSDPDTWVGSFDLIDKDELKTAYISVSGGQDIAGNVMVPGEGTFEVDTVGPNVVIPITVSDPMITDADIGNPFEVIVTFDENMDMSVDPTVSFTPDVTATLPSLVGSWTDGTHYVVGCSIADGNQEVAHVSVNIDGAQDIAGNPQGSVGLMHLFAIDNKNPTVDISVSDDMISDADVPGPFKVTATFSEAMDPAFTPTVSFDQNVDSTLTSAIGAWIGNTVYEVTYTTADAGVEMTDVGVRVGGAKDLADNLQALDPTIKLDAFSIDTLAPAVPTYLIAPAYINFANQGSYPVSGTAEAGTTVEVRLADGIGGIVTKTGPADGGAFSIVVDASGLSEGIIDIDAMATDAAGNTSPWSYATTVTKDTIKPTCSATAVPALAKAGPVAVTVEFSEAMDMGVGPNVMVTGLKSLYAVSGGFSDPDTWLGSFTLFDEDEEKTATISVSGGKDLAGNEMVPGAGTFAVDTKEPTVTITIADPINIANVGTVSVTITSDEDGDYFYDISDGVIHIQDTGLITAGTPISFDLDLTSLSDGLITADASVEDAAGNDGDAPQATAIKDTIAPNPTWIDISLLTDEDGNGIANIGDTLSVLARTDPDTVSVTADLRAYGGSEDEALTKITITVPTIDGDVGEWTNEYLWFTDNTGNEYFGEVPEFTYYKMNDEQNLYFAIIVNDPTPLAIEENGQDDMWLAFRLDDGDNYPVFRKGYTTDPNLYGQLSVTGAYGAYGPLPVDVEFGWNVDADHIYYEWKIPLALLGVSPGETIKYLTHIREWSVKAINYHPEVTSWAPYGDISQFGELIIWEPPIWRVDFTIVDSLTGIDVGAGNTLSAVTATATDDVGNTATGISNNLAEPVDSLAPEPPTGLTATAVAEGKIQLDWTASVSGDIASYTIYRGIEPDPITLVATGVTGTSWTEPDPLEDGEEYYYRMRSVDDADNIGVYSDEASATADSTPPDAPTDLDAPDYINLANQGSYPVSGIAEPGSTVEVRVGTVTATCSADLSTRAFSIAVDASLLDDGDVDIDARATDTVGNTGPWSDPITVIKDTVEPEVSIDIPEYINLANVDKTLVTITSDEAGTYSYDVSGEIGSGDISAGTPVVFDLDLSGLADGVVTADASVEDAAGNVGHADPDSAIKDTVEPEVSIDIPEYINLANVDKTLVTITSDEAGTYSYDVSGEIGSGDISAGTPVVFDLDLSGLADGVVTADASVEDAAGNVGHADPDSAIKDTVEPTVTDVTVSPTLLSDSEVGLAFTVTVDYSEAMKGVPPTITFDSTSDSTLDFTGGSWTDDDTYVATYDVADAGVTVDDVNILVEDAEDLAGNVQVEYTKSEAFDIDTENPTVIDLEISDLWIREDDIPGSFTVTVTFSEPMSVAPTISFSEDIYSTLEFDSDDWSADYTVYTATYTIVDVGEYVSGVAITVEGAEDIAGNLQVQYVTDPLFDVDTLHGTSDPESIVVKANGEDDLTVTIVDEVHLEATVWNWFDEKISGVEVSFSTDLGTIYPLIVPTAGGSAQTSIFSTDLGTANVVATAGIFSDSCTITFVEQTIEIELSLGWNLVSVPRTLAGPAIEEVFAGITTVEKVYTYDGDWHCAFFEDGMLQPESTLIDIDDGKGYWVYTSEPKTITIKLKPLEYMSTPPSYLLPAEWSLIGYTSIQLDAQMPVDAYLSYLTWNTLYRFNPYTRMYEIAKPTADTIHGFQEFELGRGYWIYLSLGDELVP